MTPLLLALCGGLGAALRYLADTLLKERARVHPALSIVVINVLGSFAFGALLPHVDARGGFTVWAGVAAGCGGFTTFSTASLDTLKFFRNDTPLLGVVHAVGTLAACVLAALAGATLFG